MIAIFLHVYYPRTWADINQRLKNFPFPFNLYVNLVENYSDSLTNVISNDFPNAKINISPNMGMDPGGQLRTLNYWLKNGQNEDFFIFIHSKNNDSLRELMMSIITPEKARLAMEKFNDPSVGMVGVKEWNLHPPKMYGDPIHFCDFYCEKLGLNNFETNRFGFIGGTQFWVRSSIYKNIFENYPILDLVNELVPYETGGKTHALERIFGYIVLSANYKIEGI
jgi:lipopolysaccharide biosynthesis protein